MKLQTYLCLLNFSNPLKRFGEDEHEPTLALIHIFQMGGKQPFKIKILFQIVGVWNVLVRESNPREICVRGEL